MHEDKISEIKDILEEILKLHPSQLALVRQGVGQSGANPEYVQNTVGHLEEMGIVDGPLHQLLLMLP